MTVSSYEQAAYSFFLAHGLTGPQSAGVVGNLVQESGVNPESVQPGGPGRGIAQWSAGGRWQPGLMTGNPAVDLQNQLAFMWQEMTGPESASLAAVRATSDPAAAATAFELTYERAGSPNMAARTGAAQRIYGGGDVSLVGFHIPIPGGLGLLPGMPTVPVPDPTGGLAGGLASGLVKPFIDFIDQWAIRSLLFVAGAIAILVGLAILTSDTGKGSSSSGGGGGGSAPGPGPARTPNPPQPSQPQPEREGKTVEEHSEEHFQRVRSDTAARKSYVAKDVEATGQGAAEAL